MLYPEQSVAANPNRCWNWFLPEHQRRDAGEPAAILSLVNEIVGRHPIDRTRIYVVGLSAGGALAAILAEVAPDVFAAAGIMAGVALHAAHDVPSAFAAMRGDAARPNAKPVVAARAENGDDPYRRLRVSIWTGARDRLVAPANAARLLAQFSEAIGLAPEGGVAERRGQSEIVRFSDPSGRVRLEMCSIDEMGHAWSGGSFRGSHTWPKGPRATDEFMAFFLETDLVEATFATR